ASPHAQSAEGDNRRGTFIVPPQVRPARGPPRPDLPGGARGSPEAVRERDVLRVPRPVLPRRDGPRGRTPEEPPDGRRPPPGGPRPRPRAGLGGRRPVHGQGGPGPRVHRGRAGQRDGNVAPGPRGPGGGPRGGG